MATIESSRYSFDLPRTPAFRHARCYAPEPVTSVLRDVIAASQLALIIDVDTLERSALARVDRVMLLALADLAHAGVDVVLIARDERERAAILQRGIRGSHLGPSDIHVVPRDRLPRGPLVAISDDPHLLGALTADDRGIAVGRPELARFNIATAADLSVRATLWWMVEERTRATLTQVT